MKQKKLTIVLLQVDFSKLKKKKKSKKKVDFEAEAEPSEPTNAADNEEVAGEQDGNSKTIMRKIKVKTL